MQFPNDIKNQQKLLDQNKINPKIGMEEIVKF